MAATADDPWSGLSPAEVQRLLEPVRVEWWVSGGWALDLWLGRTTRPHGDFDVGCRARDTAELLASLAGWDAYLAEGGEITPLGRTPPAKARGIWLRRSGTEAWDLQLMPEEDDTGTWRYRRDRSVSRRFGEITWVADTALVVLRPEIQLLYKSKDIRPRDQADFEAVLPTLPAPTRAWLAAALERTAPSSPWLDRLRSHGASEDGRVAEPPSQPS